MFRHLKVILLATKLFGIITFPFTSIISDIYLKKENTLETSEQLLLYSCKDECEKYFVLPTSHCFCNAHCIVYRNCCEDFSTQCPEVAKEGIKRFGHLLNLQVECLQLAAVFAITGCPNQTVFTKKLINDDSSYDVINNVPIIDVNSGLVYANMDIFNCNVPNTSNSGIRWTITITFRILVEDDLVSKLEYYRLLKPFYRTSATKWWFDGCTPRTVSNCNYSNLARHGEITIDPEKGLLRTSLLPWKEAKCDMSENDTFSKPNCQIVKCSSHKGFYLNEDGTCRKFTLLIIGLQNDLWLLNQHEYDDLLNYMMYYLSRSMDVIPLGSVKPLCSLYSTELHQNFSIATFLLDFNSSAAEDYIYMKFKDELSILASDVRAMIEHKVSQMNQSNPRFELVNDVIGQRWAEAQRNKSKSGLMFFRWCRSPKLNFSLFTSAQNKSRMCLSRLIEDETADHCFELTEGDFRCYDELFPDSFQSRPTASFANIKNGNFVLLIAQHIFMGVFHWNS